MKIEKMCSDIFYFCKKLILTWRTFACSLWAQEYCEYFPLLPKYKIIISYLRAEPEISKEARSGQYQPRKFNDFLAWWRHMYFLLFLRSSEAVLVESADRFPFYCVVAWSLSGTRITELLARKQPAGLFINIDEILSY